MHPWLVFSISSLDSLEIKYLIKLVINYLQLGPSYSVF